MEISGFFHFPKDTLKVGLKKEKFDGNLNWSIISKIKVNYEGEFKSLLNQ